jgi:hypothetical protein
MPRTTTDVVAQIIEVDSAIDVEPFIEIANELVTEACGDAGYSDTRLELIERWLAAHFYAIRDNRVATEGAGTVNTTYQFRVGLNLNVTIYGQQALVLDTKGLLAALSKQAETGESKRPGLMWLGSDD